MIRKQITFPSDTPMTRSAAAVVVQKAASFTSHIMIEHDQKIVNAKSMLGLLSLYSEARNTLTLITDGDDEVAASDAISALIANGYRE